MSSAEESETCGTFNNRKTSIGMRPALISLDHKQPEAPLKTENSTTEGFVNLGMKSKRSKIWDIKWHWLREKEVLEQLRLYWEKEANNYANYFTKYHPPIHHSKMRPRYIHTSNVVRKIPQTIRLCESVLNRVPDTQFRIESLKVIWAKP